MPRQYPKDFRDRAVRLVVESREDYETGWAAIQVVASRLNVGAEAERLIISGGAELERTEGSSVLAGEVRKVAWQFERVGGRFSRVHAQ